MQMTQIKHIYSKPNICRCLPFSNH